MQTPIHPVKLAGQASWLFASQTDDERPIGLMKIPQQFKEGFAEEFVKNTWYNDVTDVTDKY